MSNLSDIRDDLPYWLALNRIDSLKPKIFLDLVKKFGSAKNVWQARALDFTDEFDKELIDKIQEGKKKFDPEKLFLELEKKKVGVILIIDKSYPKNLLEIYDPPPLLFYRGQLLPKDRFSLAVVGSRRMTAYGREITERLVGELVFNNLTIVSGLARGIDSTAHKAAIDNRGRTIAVLGSGIDVIYPAENVSLYNKIINEGSAVVSEFPPSTKPLAFNFPKRNRIIAGLSLGVLVVEAAEQSGSLITAGLAADYGREVFAVPGPINYPTAVGTGNLIKSGAKLVTKIDDILDELRIEKKTKLSRLSKRETISDDELIILKTITSEPKHVDQIVRETNMPASKILAILSLMELSGKVKQLEKGIYQLAS